MRRAFIVIGVLAALSATGYSQTETSPPGASTERRGLTIDASISSSHSTADPTSSDNYLFSIGAGYNISRRLSAGLRIYTGSIRLSAETAPLQNGYFALGGGELEGAYSFPAGGNWRPFVSAGFMIATIVQFGGIGYNGNGLRISGGVEYDLSRFFSVEISVDYARHRFYNLVNQIDPGNLFSPFTEQCIGLRLGISFNSNIVP